MMTLNAIKLTLWTKHYSQGDSSHTTCISNNVTPLNEVGSVSPYHKPTEILRSGVMSGNLRSVHNWPLSFHLIL